MKKFFNSRLLRERLLLLAFALIGATWWGAEIVTRARAQVLAAMRLSVFTPLTR